MTRLLLSVAFIHSGTLLTHCQTFLENEMTSAGWHELYSCASVVQRWAVKLWLLISGMTS